mmetsp:Transcript_69856/g.204463  ORF Transcript_69856/g.204463 Transcript_69856/m.204463 type:complete len:213 (+) Transcript_69856:1010-1648(+)
MLLQLLAEDRPWRASERREPQARAAPAPGVVSDDRQLLDLVRGLPPHEVGLHVILCAIHSNADLPTVFRRTSHHLALPPLGAILHLHLVPRGKVPSVDPVVVTQEDEDTELILDRRGMLRQQVAGPSESQLATKGLDALGQAAAAGFAPGAAVAGLLERPQDGARAVPLQGAATGICGLIDNSEDDSSSWQHRCSPPVCPEVFDEGRLQLML